MKEAEKEAKRNPKARPERDHGRGRHHHPVFPNFPTTPHPYRPTYRPHEEPTTVVAKLPGKKSPLHHPGVIHHEVPGDGDPPRPLHPIHVNIHIDPRDNATYHHTSTPPPLEYQVRAYNSKVFPHHEEHDDKMVLSLLLYIFSFPS